MSAAPEKKAAEESSIVCPICMEPLLDEGVDHAAQDALFCEWDCQCWHHRWCASVTKERYAVLSDSADPFLCPSCTAISQKAAIESLRGCLNALTDEVLALKASFAALQNQKEPLDRGTAEKPPHSESVGLGQPLYKDGNAVDVNPIIATIITKISSCSQRTQSSDLQPRTFYAQEERGPSTQPQASRGKNRVRVVGARKI